MAQKALVTILLVSCFLPASAQAEGNGKFVFKLASPFEGRQRYEETFPTEVQATARLWNELKVDALERQTETLQIEFERVKAVRFLRDRSLANRFEMEPAHLPAVTASLIRF